MLDKIREIPMEVVDITSPAMNAQLGRYFIGQTGELNFGNKYNAWGGIINPENSGINIYFDIFTITNFSAQNNTAEIWMNANTPQKAVVSPVVIPSNQAISPPPKAKAVLQYADNFKEPLTEGVAIFSRIVPPNSTLVSDSHQGSMIIGPGRSISILLKSTGSQPIKGTIVLTWWEENIRCTVPWIGKRW